MPIWIKSGNDLLLCDSIRVSETRISGVVALYAYQSCSDLDMPSIIVKNLTESEAQDLMRDITRAVASGDRYFEIPERYMQNERT